MDDPDMAFLKGPCKECGGKGKVMQWDCHVILCLKCHGVGETYLLGDMVRKKCLRKVRRTHGEPTYYHPDGCDFCHGLEFTPSTELGDWTDAAAAIGTPLILRRNAVEWVVWYQDMEDKQGHDADLMVAIKVMLGNVLEVK